MLTIITSGPAPGCGRQRHVAGRRTAPLLALARTARLGDRFLPATRALLLAATCSLLAALVWTTPAAAQNSAAPQNTEAKRVQGFVDQANRLQREGKLDQALKALDDGLKVAPRDPRLRFAYGVVLNQQKQYPQAIDVFQQMTEDYPELPEPYNNLAVLYAQRGDLDQARASLERAIRALPNYALAQENLGDVYVRLAVRAFEQANRIDAKGDAQRKLRLTDALMARLSEPPPARSSRAPAASDLPAGDATAAQPRRPASSLDSQSDAPAVPAVPDTAPATPSSTPPSYLQN